MASSNTPSVSSGDAVLDIGPQTCKDLNLILERENLLSSGITSGEAAGKGPAKIQRVTRLLREVEKNKVNYDPRLVSIGPYHHGDPNLVLGHTLKIELVQNFGSYVKTKRKSLNNYFQSKKFDEVAHKARECYAKDDLKLAKFNEEEFKCLMFLDGCFVVYFIHCIVKNPDDVQIKNDHKAIMTMDLLLLENQLPYTILQALKEEFMPSQENEKEDIFRRFIINQTKHEGIKGRSLDCCSCLFKQKKEQTSPDCCSRLFKPKQEQTSPADEKQTSANCCSRLFKPKKEQTSLDGERKTSPADEKPNPSASEKDDNNPLHLLDFFRTELLHTVKPQQGDYRNGWQSFRSVHELKASGIKCVISDESSENKVDFISRGPIARLFLPATIIDDSFKTKWLNLAAYEACPDFMKNGEITSFICFMDSLIDGPEDVKELRVQGVLQNFLGSDQHVADLFNELATDLAPNFDQYRHVRNLIQNHFNNKGWLWVTDCVTSHFSSPWTVIAFFAAVLLGFLTIVQTYYSIFPAPKDK